MDGPIRCFMSDVFPMFQVTMGLFFSLGREGRSKVVIQQRARDAGLEAIGRDYRYMYFLLWSLSSSIM